MAIGHGGDALVSSATGPARDDPGTSNEYVKNRLHERRHGQARDDLARLGEGDGEGQVRGPRVALGHAGVDDREPARPGRDAHGDGAPGTPRNRPGTRSGVAGWGRSNGRNPEDPAARDGREVQAVVQFRKGGPGRRRTRSRRSGADGPGSPSLPPPVPCGEGAKKTRGGAATPRRTPKVGAEPPPRRPPVATTHETKSRAGAVTWRGSRSRNGKTIPSRGSSGPSCPGGSRSRSSRDRLNHCFAINNTLCLYATQRKHASTTAGPARPARVWSSLSEGRVGDGRLPRSVAARLGLRARPRRHRRGLGGSGALRGSGRGAGAGVTQDLEDETAATAHYLAGRALQGLDRPAEAAAEFERVAP